MRARFFQHRKRVVAAIAVAVLLIALVVAYIATRWNNVPFETIEQLDGPSSLRHRPDTKPAVFVVARPEEIEAIKPYVSDEAALALGGLNFENEFAVAAFQGLQGADFRGTFHLEYLIHDGPEIRLYAHPDSSDPTIMAPDIMTSPYHIIKIQREVIRSGSYTFTLYWRETNSMVASTTYSFPQQPLP